MSQKWRSRAGSNGSKGSKYDDWVCLLCQNHNYSFRMVCNRCHSQTKQKNNYMLQLYHEQLEVQTQITSTLQNQHDHAYLLHSFPNVLLLMINDDPWEEQPQWREPPQTQNPKWINTLIEE